MQALLQTLLMRVDDLHTSAMLQFEKFQRVNTSYVQFQLLLSMKMSKTIIVF